MVQCPSDRPTIKDYYTKDDDKHNSYCAGITNELECSPAEGCKWENSKAGTPQDPKCQLNSEYHLGNVYINGGFGFGKLCLDNNFSKFVLLLVYPPLYIYIMEKKTAETNKKSIQLKPIIMCFIYTSMFYFPGLLYGMYYMFTKKRMTCMGDFLADTGRIAADVGTLGMVRAGEEIDQAT